MSRKKGGSSSWQDQIESMLQRIQRQATTSVRRPPDPASAALGKDLGKRLLAGVDVEKNARLVADKIVACLCEVNHTSPSLPTFFFDALSAAPHDVFLTWMPRWILQAEEACTTTPNYSGALETLSCVIHSYAQCCYKLENDVSPESISDTYSRLKTSSSRTCMLREFVHYSFKDSSTNTFITLLTPLMASCVLDLSSPSEEKMLFLQGVWRAGWSCDQQNSSAADAMQFLSWMAESLHLFLNGIPNETRDRQVISMELAYQWFTELAEMIAGISIEKSDSLAALLAMIFNKILPHFIVSPTAACHFSVQPIIDPLCSVISSMELAIPFDRATWFRLGALTLSTANTQDVSSLLKLLTTLSSPRDGLVQGMLYSLACIFSNDDKHKESVKHLFQRAVAKGDEQHDETEDLTSIVQLFRKGDDEESLLKFMTTSLENVDPSKVFAFDQTCTFLMGCSLLRYKPMEKGLVYSYLKALLQQFPHLGISLLPILFQSIQTACDDSDGMALLHQLDFLCDAVVKDPNCAQEVWNLVGVNMIQPDSPTSVRSVAVRMFPKLCASNKKLYRRVIDALGSLVDDSQPQIRLAVAATIDDLAREDRIRDVSDVIGWIQSYLSDESPSVAHFAVLCLHHLVVAQELDFNLVMKVLNKRLCSVGDIDMLLALPASVLEALVLLLGDGECDVDGSDEDEGVTSKVSQDLIGVSPQVSSAVATLILLANSDALSQTNQSPSGSFAEEEISRIQLNICRSLSNYSIHTLGLDDEGVQSATTDRQKSEDDQVAVTESGLQYIELKQIASTELESPSLLSFDSLDSDPTVLLTRKILSLEEESLGASVWQKRSKNATSKPSRTTAPKAAFSALPSPGQIQEMYSDDPSLCTAVAALLCYSGGSVEDLFDLASDASSEGVHDPISYAFMLQGWIRAMSMIWAGILSSTDSSKLEAVTSVVEEVNGWRELLDNGDISYLALATFALFVPDTMTDQDGSSDVDFSQIMESVRNDILLAYDGHQFESRDMADLCLGIIGARAVQSRTTAVVERSISSLEQSMAEQSGQSSFGASYGSALIAQAAAEVLDDADSSSISSSNSQHLSWISQIVSLLVHELQSCFEVTTPAFVTLVACLKTGKPTPDLLSSISAVAEEQEISEVHEHKVMCLLLSLALCVPAVGVVSSDLLLCVFKFTEKLPWGIGKGLVIANAAFQCVSAGVLRQNEIEILVAAFEQLSEDFLGQGETKRFSDVLYACIALRTYLPSKAATLNDIKLVKSITGNEGTSMSDECYSSLLLSVTVLVSTFPCLANGGQMFCSASKLHAHLDKETVRYVVALLSDAARRDGSTKSICTATQSLGLLASMKSGTAKATPISVFGRSVTGSAAGSQKSKQTEVNLEMLPNPHDKTLLESVMVCIKREWELVNTGTQSSTSALSRLLCCLESLSLPGEFARSFIEPILASKIEELKPACIALLMSQVSGRRRAAFDGREFVTLANRLALLPPSSFQGIMGQGSGSVEFISSLNTFLPKLPSDNIEAVLLNLWKICEAELEERHSTSCAEGYLGSLSTLLETKQKKESLRLSPRTYTIIIQVLLRAVFSTLAVRGTETLSMMHSVEKAFLDCLSRLELTVLEENKFFVLSGDVEHEATDLSKAFCIVGLVGRKYFEQESRSSRELLKVVAWFANQRGSLSTDDLRDVLLRELAFRIAIASEMEDPENKKDIISIVFEALLVHGPVACLELLGMLTSAWSNGLGCDPEESSVCTFFNAANQDSMLPPATMSNLSRLLLNDAPFNSAAWGRSQKLQGLIANSVARIVKSWLERGVSQQELAPLESIRICCRAQETTKEGDFATLIISKLAPQVDTKVSA